MKRLTRVLAALLCLVVVLPTAPALAAGSPSSGPECENHPETCGTATGDTVVLSGGAASPGAPGGSASGGPAGAPVALSPTYQRIVYAPTCSTNDYQSTDTLCEAAVATCLPPGTGLIRYWRWVLTIDRATGDVLSEKQLPGSVCIGPSSDVPVVPAVAGLLEQQFKDLVVLRGTTATRPQGTTLVNYATQFSTTAGEYALPPVRLLGHTVVVTAHPKTYDWYFGDGTTALDAGPGQATDSDVTHTYTATGTVSPYVVITWTGTFTVDGGASHDVFGTATTTGPGTPLEVKQARAQLVTR